MDKKERLSEAVNYLKYKGIVKTQDDIATMMRASRSNISSALSGKESVLTDNFIARFCATFSCISYTWLLKGMGDMISSTGKTINDRVRDILKMETKSLKVIGEECSVDFSQLQCALDNDNDPSEKMIEYFCKALQVNEEWLRNGSGEIYETERNLMDTNVLKKHMEALPTRPRLPKSMSESHIENFYGNGSKRILCQEKPVVTQFSDYDFSLILKNNRMSPKYERGDEVFFKKARIPEWGNDFLLDTDDGPKFKRIYKDKDEDGKSGVRCVSYNKEEFPDFFVEDDMIHGFYRCVGVLRIL